MIEGNSLFHQICNNSTLNLIQDIGIPRSNRKNTVSSTTPSLKVILSSSTTVYELESHQSMYLSLPYPHAYSIRLTQNRVSGYQEPQSPTQVAILQQLTGFLRSGKYTGDIGGTPSKIVRVGHSFGSYISNALIATSPQLSDAAILTGIAYASAASGTFVEAFGLRIARLQAPGKWPGRDNEYLTWVDIAANAATFFHGGSYDEKVIQYTEGVKQPIAAAELITISSEDILPSRSPEFSAPVMVRSFPTPSIDP